MHTHIYIHIYIYIHTHTNALDDRHFASAGMHNAYTHNIHTYIHTYVVDGLCWYRSCTHTHTYALAGTRFASASTDHAYTHAHIQTHMHAYAVDGLRFASAGMDNAIKVHISCVCSECVRVSFAFDVMHISPPHKRINATHCVTQAQCMYVYIYIYIYA